MGQELSQEQIDPNTPPKTLSSRSLEGVAEYIKDGPPKRIVVLTGAGISTSAGIPDFRSPGTGLYANLARLGLPYAEAVFDISYFREHPEPFYALAKELYPGQFYPTVSHAFIALLNRKSMLEHLFTQNIDCLERRAGVPDDKIMEAHGSFATQRCIDCRTEYPDDLMKKMVESGDVPHCLVPECNGLVKPDIVFFGESLPAGFHSKSSLVTTAELIFVIGTSLSVQPFASLPQYAREGVPRILFNKERVGDLGGRLDDVVVLGDCDGGVRKLADALGWRDELEALWKEVGGSSKEEEAGRLLEERRGMSKDEILEAEIAKITSEVDQSLKLSKDHTDWVNDTLSKAGKTPESGHSKSADVLELADSKSEETGSKSLSTNENDSSTPKITAEESTVEPVINTEAKIDTTMPQHRDEKSPADSKI